MGWDKTAVANDELLVNTPALIRANWAALELLTDAALLITNAKVSASAAIVDTKLAQITTAAKVSGAAITLLTSVPSGAGVLPDANSPQKLKADASDTTPQYLDSLIDTAVFQVSAGDLLQLKDGGVEMEKLESGSASPGNSKYYGTNAGGTKGFFDVNPAFPAGAIVLWSGAVSAIPAGFVICDGNNSTPDLTDRFVIHADADALGTNDVGDTGGASTHCLSVAEMPSHRHLGFEARTHGGTGSNQAYPSNPYTAAMHQTTATDADWTSYFTDVAQRTAYTGGGTTHTNRDKYYALAYIQKT